MNAAFQTAFKRDRTALTARPRLGNGRAGLAARRINNEGAMGRFSSQRQRSTFVRQTTGVPNLRHPAAQLSAATSAEKEVAEKFASLVKGYSKNDLAAISGRTPEAAKHWKDATRAPNSASLLTMGRQIDAVRDWVAVELGIEIHPAPLSSDKSAAAMALLQAIASMGGDAAAAAKAGLRALQSGGN